MSGRILIAEDVATNRIVYQSWLAAAVYDPVLATDGKTCLAAALSADPAERPDLVLLDLGLPDMSGRDVLRQLRSDPRGRDLPVIVLTASQSRTDVLEAFASGADDVMVKPVAEGLLLARVRNLMRARSETEGDAALSDAAFAEPAAVFERPGTLALLAAPSEAVEALRNGLTRRISDRVTLLSRTQVLAEASEQAVPDVLVIDAREDGLDAGLRLLSELRSHPRTRHSAVCLIERSGQPDLAAIAFDLGADDVVGPDVGIAEVAERLRGLMRRKRAADRRRTRMQDGLRLALLDPLTGLYNRRYAMPQLGLIAEKAAMSGQQFAVMVVDLDRFKAVNDQHGHGAGDAVLIEVSRRLAANLRDNDLLARIGGEEFLAVLPDTSMAEARVVAERLCGVIDSRPILLPSGARLRVTVSIGVAVSGSGGPIEGVVEQADLALLESKGAGRNQVTFRLSAA